MISNAKPSQKDNPQALRVLRRGCLFVQAWPFEKCKLNKLIGGITVMSTSAYIFVEIEEDLFKGSYVHFDGYFEGVGAKLNEHYNDLKKATELVQLGNLAALGSTLEPSEAVKRFGVGSILTTAFRALPESEKARLQADDQSGKYTIAYHRDAHEDLKTIVQKNFATFTDSFRTGYELVNYIYLFSESTWFYLDKNRFQWRSLKNQLSKIKGTELA